MARIKFETGQTVNFDGIPTQADVDEVARSLGIGQPTPTQSKSFLRPRQLAGELKESVVEPFRETVTALTEAQRRQERGEQGVGRTALTAIGQGAQAPFEAAFGAGFNLISAAIPDFIEDPIRRISASGSKKLLQTEKGLSLLEAARGIEDRFNTLEPKDQQAIKDIFGVALTALDIGTVGAGGRVSRAGLERAGARAGQVGEELIETAGRETTETIRGKFANLIIDDSTPTKRAALASRTKEGGAFTGRQVQLTDRENLIIDELQTIQELNPSRSALFNLNILTDEIGVEAKLLRKQLTDDNFIFPKAELKTRLRTSLEVLKREDTDVIGEAETLADRIFTRMEVFIDAEKGTGLGGLTARQNYDKWVRTKKPKAFEKQDAFNTINREARNIVNDFLAEKAPSAPVKESLQRQSRLISSSDTLSVKSAKEAGTGFVRLLDRSTAILGTKNKLVQLLAAAVGIGGLGAAATFAPVIAGLGGTVAAGVLVKKALTSPTAKKKLGEVLVRIEKILPKATGEERTILQEIKDEISAFIK